LAAALRLWLVVCLWPTPLPWVHRHEGAAVDLPRLVAHLQEYHSHDAAEAESGWHLHFAFLWQLARGEECPGEQDETPPNELPATPTTIALAIGISPTCSAGPVVATLDFHAESAGDVLSNRAAELAFPPTAFLNSYRGAVAPHQLIRVYLC
jgi:hypothetical protein